MDKVEGKKIFGGIAIGKILYYAKERNTVIRQKAEDTAVELERFEQAKTAAAAQLNELYEKAVKEVGELNARIFEVHAMLLEDEDYNDSVKNLIETQGVNAEYAVAATGDNFAKMFLDMEDEYFKARSVDIKDVSERIISVLSGGRDTAGLTKPCILVAEDLAPSETVQMDKDMLMAFVTRLGSTNSHTAILARTMGIPALVKVEIREDWNGKLAIVDGFEGIIIVEPDEETLKEYEKKKAEVEEQKQLLQELKGKETITKGGRRVHLYANIGNVSDLGAVLKNDAAGIGLFRSEFLYLEKEDFPTEEEQLAAYRQVAETMADKRVIIRTLDIGADKQAGYFNLGKEENPAMGYRAIRICLTRTDIFKTQLRAILRASAFGRIGIMYPMITSVEEVHQIKKLVKEAKAELDSMEIAYGNVEQGIMIETPAAAIISDILAKEVDFFSIGTNDLTQYTLAIDRQNNRLDRFYNEHHEAIMRLIKMVVDNAHAAGKWAGICGELGADTELTKTFLEMGVDELSVSPGMILPVRKVIRQLEI